MRGERESEGERKVRERCGREEREGGERGDGVSMGTVHSLAPLVGLSLAWEGARGGGCLLGERVHPGRVQ